MLIDFGRQLFRNRYVRSETFAALVELKGRQDAFDAIMLLAYPATMSFLLVYYAEHYVIDILAGYAIVARVMTGWSLWERVHQPRSPSGADQGS